MHVRRLLFSSLALIESLGKAKSGVYKFDCWVYIYIYIPELVPQCSACTVYVMCAELDHSHFSLGENVMCLHF